MPMAKAFIYPPINPIAGYPVLPVNPYYNSDQYQPPSTCYCQKRQQNDPLQTLQFFSDWVPDLKFYRDDGTLFTTIACTAQTTTVTNPGFTAVCYQANIDYSTFPIGKYNGRFHWVDDNNVDQYYQLMWINVAQKWKYTRIFEYKNDINDFGILFDVLKTTNTLFYARVEGSLINTIQKFSGDSYIDEEQNATALPSIAYEQKTLSLGFQEGVPDWLGRVFNYILQCSFILIDGAPYQKVQGAKWDIIRPELASKNEETTSNYNIDVMLVDNAFVERLNSTNVALNGYIPYLQVEKLNGVGSDQNITLSGGWAGLHEVWINNLGAIPFTLSIGTTVGGSQIGVFDIPANGKVIEVREAFYSSSQLIYLSGLTGVIGVNASFRIEWLDYNAVPVSGPASVPPVSQLPRGSITSYKEILPGDFATDFDLATGLGKIGGRFPNCALCDGRNGTDNLGGKFEVGFLNGDVVFGIASALVGSNNIVITDVTQLPPHSFTFQRPRADTVGTQYQGNFAKSGGNFGLWTGDDALTNTLGTSAPIPFLPLSIVSIKIMALS